MLHAGARTPPLLVEKSDNCSGQYVTMAIFWHSLVGTCGPIKYTNGHHGPKSMITNPAHVGKCIQNLTFWSTLLTFLLSQLVKNIKVYKTYECYEGGSIMFVTWSLVHSSYI